MGNRFRYENYCPNVAPRFFALSKSYPGGHRLTLSDQRLQSRQKITHDTNSNLTNVGSQIHPYDAEIRLIRRNSGVEARSS